MIGNGDLDSADRVVDVFRKYAVDGVMIARACLGRPWLFAQAAAALRGEPVPADPTLEEQKHCMLKHYQLVVDRFGESKGDAADAQVCLLLRARPFRRTTFPNSRCQGAVC